MTIHFYPVPPKYLTLTLSRLRVLVVKSNIKIMAKKNTNTQPEFIDNPEIIITTNTPVIILPELQTVVESSKLAISKAQKHAQALSPFMTVINELTQPLAKMDKENPTSEMAELARTTRLKMVKNRTASAEVKDALKSDLLIEGKLIDSLYGVIKNASELTESEYANIEKFEINRVAQLKTKLKTERLALLTPFEVPGLEFFQLDVMPEDQFANLLANSKAGFEAKNAAKIKAEQDAIEAAKLAEEQRLKAEQEQRAERERLRLENERLLAEQQEKEKIAARGREWQGKLIAAGLVYNGSDFVYKETTVTVQDIVAKSDKELQKIVDTTAKQVAKDNETAQAEKAKTIEEQRRKNSFTELGLKIDSGGDFSYDGVPLKENVNAILYLTAEKFEKWYDKTKKFVDDKKAAALKKYQEMQAENEKFLQAEKKRLDEEKAKAAAPDKDKINALYLSIKGLMTLPELVTPEYKAIGMVAVRGLQEVLNQIKIESNKLK